MGRAQTTQPTQAQTVKARRLARLNNLGGSTQMLGSGDLLLALWEQDADNPKMFCLISRQGIVQRRASQIIGGDVEPGVDDWVWTDRGHEIPGEQGRRPSGGFNVVGSGDADQALEYVRGS